MFYQLNCLIFSMVFCMASALAGPQATNLNYGNIKLKQLPDAKVFTLKTNSLDIVGADIGPANGRPVLLIPGFATTFLYLAPLINMLTERGHRVFVYNPPGQGHRELESRGPSAKLGIAGMAEAAILMHKAVWNTMGKPVTIVGHSLGGISARFASTYIPRNQIEKLILLNSPSVTHLAPESERRMLVVAYLSGPLAKLASLSDFFTLGMSTYIAERNLVEFIAFNQNGALSAMWGAENFNKKSLSQNIQGFLFWQATNQITDDVIEANFDSLNGEDMSERWAAANFNRPPTVSVAGLKDELAFHKNITAEARKLGYHYKTANTGHIGGLYDIDVLPQLVKIISMRP